jgi:DNA-binding MarR family transcriptional regulator
MGNLDGDAPGCMGNTNETPPARAAKYTSAFAPAATAPASSPARPKDTAGTRMDVALVIMCGAPVAAIQLSLTAQAYREVLDLSSKHEARPALSAAARRPADGTVPRAWVQLLRVHATMTHEMDGRLRAAHGLALSEYEVLLFLSWAPDVGMRPVDLAKAVLLTQGGITRMLDRLDRAGAIERSRSTDDGRVVYARLTDAGRKRLRDAASTHVTDVRDLFAKRFADDEMATLASLLELLPGGDVGTDLAVHPVRNADSPRSEKRSRNTLDGPSPRRAARGGNQASKRPITAR